MIIKQILVWRKDLNVRKGKLAAQIAHASSAWLIEKYKQGSFALSQEEQEWLDSGHRKICVYVESETELLVLFDAAKTSGLTTHLITDSGLTEFNGVPTRTCLSVGPHAAEKIDPLTKDLKLL